MPTITIITAFLNEAENLPVFRERLQSVLNELGLSYQIILVDDHSSDDSPNLARQWADQDAAVTYVRLSRNSGSHSAFSAGLAWAEGECVVLLAADLQDPPETIGELMRQWRAGNDVVWAARSGCQQESWSAKLFSRVYWRMMQRLGSPQTPALGADFLLMDRKVVQAYNAIREKNTSFFAMIQWLGFRQTSITYVKQARQAGLSKWNFSKKLKLFVDSIVSTSYAPIRLMSVVGLLLALLGLAYGVLVVFNYLFLGNPVQGWSSLMVVVVLIGGCQLGMMGVLGEYLWRTYDECRGRPRYVVEEIRGANAQVPSRNEAA